MNIIHIFLLILSISQVRSQNSVWHWVCNTDNLACDKYELTDDIQNPLSLTQCEITCLDSAGIWPKPVSVIIGTEFANVDETQISFSGVDSSSAISELVNQAGEIFVVHLQSYADGGAAKVPVNVELVIANLDLDRQDVDTIENYSLTIDASCTDQVSVSISADNFFGARHGLETLNQLIVLDDLRGQLVVPCGVSIEDGPVYKWRGVLLDTSRNFATADTIKRTIDAMGATKLNVFHWHLTDTASFPFESTSRPELTQLGSYSSQKIYTKEIIQSVIDYGRVRGVRVIPEFDAPAHVGEGWQNTNFLTCFNWKPWLHYCQEPPCGQFDPTKDELYEYLADVYKDMLNVFDPEVFHMGGDEVNFPCWQDTPGIAEWMEAQGWGTTTEDFIKLWAYFQNRALEKLDEQTGEKKRVMLWTSDLTKSENVTQILPPDRYYIQVWTSSWDAQILNLLGKGYQLILSNYDALYFDCGFPSWVEEGNNWCSPYIPWTKVYENKPNTFVWQHLEGVLGGEATLWTEGADSTAIDSRLWPRASAMAEAFWAEPPTTWRDALNRMLIHRERLVRLGVKAEAITPEWCRQNQARCVSSGP